VADKGLRELERQASNGDQDAARQLVNEAIRGQNVAELLLPHLIRLQRYVFAQALGGDPVAAFKEDVSQTDIALGLLRGLAKAPAPFVVAPGAQGERGERGPPGGITIQTEYGVERSVATLKLPPGSYLMNLGGDVYELELPPGPCSHRNCKAAATDRCGNQWPVGSTGCCGRMFCPTHVSNHSMHLGVHETSVCAECASDDKESRL